MNSNVVRLFTKEQEKENRERAQHSKVMIADISKYRGEDNLIQFPVNRTRTLGTEVESELSLTDYEAYEDMIMQMGLAEYEDIAFEIHEDGENPMTTTIPAILVMTHDGAVMGHPRLKEDQRYLKAKMAQR